MKDSDRILKDDFVFYSKNCDIESLFYKENVHVVSLDPGLVSFGFSIEKGFFGDVTTEALKSFRLKNKLENSCWSAYIELNECFDKYKEKYWDKVSLVIIEKQMAKRPEIHRIGQHAISYFLFNCPEAIVVEISSKLKTKILEAPKKMKYNERKKWSDEMCREELRKRGDRKALLKLEGKKRTHDCSDCIVQSKALKEYLLFLYD